MGFKDFEDTMPKEFSDMARSASTNQNVPNSSSKNLELELQPNSTIPQTYFGMSPEPVVNPDRLKHYWSILGDCIDYRKEFIFRCENVDEADELKKLTYTLVFQYSDRWEVSLNDLVVKANPPSSNSVPNTF